MSNKIRKFAIKYFALGYPSGMLRASTIIYPLVVINGILVILLKSPSYFALSLLGIAVYFGFVYFRYYPVKFSELDKFQKYQYGLHNELTSEEFKEWVVISEKYR